MWEGLQEHHLRGFIPQSRGDASGVDGMGLLCVDVVRAGFMWAAVGFSIAAAFQIARALQIQHSIPL